MASSNYGVPDPQRGNSRNGSDASQEVKDSVKREIVQQAQAAGLSTCRYTQVPPTLK